MASSQPVPQSPDGGRQARIEFYVDVFEDKLHEGSLSHYVHTMIQRPTRRRTQSVEEMLQALELIGQDASVWRVSIDKLKL